MKLISGVSDWYFSQKALPHWGVLSLDCFIVLFACLIGKYFELDGIGFVNSVYSIVFGAVASMLLYALSFRFFRTYKGIVRYSSFVDLQRIVLATFVGAFLTVCLWYATKSVSFVAVNSPYGALVAFLVSTMLMWMERVMVKRMFDNFHADDAVPVAIYGTKAGGISLAKSISSVKEKVYRQTRIHQP